MRWAVYALTLAAMVLAWTVARRRPEHRAVALVLTVGLLANAGRAALLAWVLPPPNLDPAAPPLEGTLRLAIFADRALYLAWPAAVAALAVSTLARRPMWPVWAVYAAAVLGLALTYPASRFGVLRQAYLAFELAVAFVGVASLLVWRRRGERATTTTLAAGFLVAGLFAVTVFGPHRFGLFGPAWDLSRWAYLGTIGILVLLHGAHLVMPPSQPPGRGSAPTPPG